MGLVSLPLETRGPGNQDLKGDELFIVVTGATATQVSRVQRPHLEVLPRPHCRQAYPSRSAARGDEGGVYAQKVRKIGRWEGLQVRRMTLPRGLLHPGRPLACRLIGAQQRGKFRALLWAGI